MKRILLALSLCSPPIAAAQSAPGSGRWSVEAATGLTASANGPAAQTVGPAFEFLVDRALTQRVSLRVAADWGAFRGIRPACTPPGPCTSNAGAVMAALSGGITAAHRRPDAGLYGTVRVGAYMLGTEPGLQPGGYLGAGVATPTRFGAVTFEVGVHGYLAEAQRRWMVPVRVGLRWRP